MSVNTKRPHNDLIPLVRDIFSQVIELYKRSKALEFGESYMREHHGDRAGALRVARAGLRFLSGDDVDDINRVADEEYSLIHKDRAPLKKRKWYQP